MALPVVKVKDLDLTESGAVLGFGVDLIDQTVANPFVVDTLGNHVVTSAGRINAAVSAAASAAALKTGLGRLASILVTTLGTAALTITDGNGGTIIALVPASAAAGTEIKVDRRFSTSLYVNSGANTPAVTVSYD